MTLRPILAIAKKDLKIFFQDRKSLFFYFAVPILIAIFFGYLFSPKDSRERTKIPIFVADKDHSSISQAVIKGLKGDELLEVFMDSPQNIQEKVRKGKGTIGLIIPAGFGKATVKAFFQGGKKPELPLFYDPSHWAEMGVVRGLLLQYLMQGVMQEAFSGVMGRQNLKEALEQVKTSKEIKPEDKKMLTEMLQSVLNWMDSTQKEGEEAPTMNFQIPFTLHEKEVTAGSSIAYNSYAHSFAGMGVQWVLFFAIELGVGILLERKMGLWKRLRAAPLKPFSIILGKGLYGAFISFLCLGVIFAFGMLFFGIRIHGSFLGFLLICLAFSFMTSIFGLLLAAIGKTPEATRGIAIMVVLLTVMLGGGWMPAFIFPKILQQLSLLIPTRWAMDGLDGMTWRGLNLSFALTCTGILCLFTLLFGLIVLWQFRWEE